MSIVLNYLFLIDFLDSLDGDPIESLLRIVSFLFNKVLLFLFEYGLKDFLELYKDV